MLPEKPILPEKLRILPPPPEKPGVLPSLVEKPEPDAKSEESRVPPSLPEKPEVPPALLSQRTRPAGTPQAWFRHAPWKTKSSSGNWQGPAAAVPGAPGFAALLILNLKPLIRRRLFPLTALLTAAVFGRSGFPKQNRQCRVELQRR
jgi:hypothetical protein